jgi:hypothetical protein
MWSRLIGICSRIRLTLMLTILATSSIGAELATDQRFPTLAGEFLSGRKAVLPEAAAGRVALLAIGFSYESRFAVEAWVKRFRADYGANPQVTFFEIPMIGGIAQLGKWFIDSGMRSGTPKADHEHVITVYGGTGPWKERLGYSDARAAHIVLLDAKGRIRWRFSGAFDDAAYQARRADKSLQLATSQGDVLPAVPPMRQR